MISQVVISCGRIGSGRAVSRSTVRSSTCRASFTGPSTARSSELGDLMRLAENTTSSAVKAEPSCHFTPPRRWKRQTVGEVCCQLVASAGSSASVRSRRISGS